MPAFLIPAIAWTLFVIHQGSLSTAAPKPWGPLFLGVLLTPIAVGAFVGWYTLPSRRDGIAELAAAMAGGLAGSGLGMLAFIWDATESSDVVFFGGLFALPVAYALYLLPLVFGRSFSRDAVAEDEVREEVRQEVREFIAREDHESANNGS